MSLAIILIPDGSGLGGTKQLTYGTISPAVDTIHIWFVNDIRINLDATSDIIYWKCIGGGAPGTWAAITASAGFLFTGAIVGSAIATTTSYMANPGSALAVVNVAGAQRYPTSARTIRRLRVTLLANTISVSTTVTLFKNNGATAMKITILSTDVPGTKYFDAAHPVDFAGGDDFDLQLGAGIDAAAGTVKVSAILE